MAQPATAEAPAPSETVTVEVEATESEPTLHMRLVRPHSSRRVAWQSGTVDNEHMGKKKSKCCCVYRKPKPFGESSSEEEDECKTCIGHRKHKPAGEGHGRGQDPGQAQGGTPQTQGSG